MEASQHSLLAACFTLHSINATLAIVPQRGKIFVKTFFLFTVGSVCRIQQFISGSRNSLKDIRKSQVMLDQVRKWLRQVKKLLCCGFRSTGKSMGQVYQCWWRICREINVFPMLEYNMFYVLYPFVTYLLTLPSTYGIPKSFTIHTKRSKSINSS
jgi:hypothetical protein